VGAKRSAEMKEALRLHEAGINAHAAARKAGLLPSSFYRLLGKLKANADRPSVAPVPPAEKQP
jgi:hypothetical protein